MGPFLARIFAPVVKKVIEVAIPTALAWVLEKGAKFAQKWWALKQAAEEIREKNAAARDANKDAKTPEERESAAKGLSDRF